MTLTELNSLADEVKNQRIAKICGFEIKTNYVNSFDEIYQAEESIDLHNNKNIDLQVRWIKNLYKILEPTCPRTERGLPIVREWDIAFATSKQRADAFLLTFG